MSTIAARRLDCRVRNENGYNPPAKPPELNIRTLNYRFYRGANPNESRLATKELLLFGEDGDGEDAYHYPKQRLSQSALCQMQLATLETYASITADGIMDLSFLGSNLLAMHHPDTL
jgi:hypothetical protein